MTKVFDLIDKTTVHAQVIQVTNDFEKHYDLKMSREEKQETNVSLSHKWQVLNTTPPCHILSLISRAPL